MSIAGAVARRSKPVTVTRRDAGAYGQDGRFTPGSTLTATVRMVVQPVTDRPTQLLRDVAGDRTTGEVKVFVTDAALTAVSWTELRVAPPEGASGPPGDRISWNGREWEVTEDQDWSESATNAGYRRYIAAERGAA